MAEIEIQASRWRLVEVGRVVVFNSGPYAGRLAAIVEIIDHKRVREVILAYCNSLPNHFAFQVLVDGPSKEAPVPRHSAALSKLIISPIVIPKLPRAAGRGPVAKKWEEAEVEKKWAESAWAKRRAQQEKRRSLGDFERFKVMLLKKQVRFTFLQVPPVS